jgi:ABC-type dipeptide/oligopeptide/nickel transport system permease component
VVSAFGPAIALANLLTDIAYGILDPRIKAN